MARHSRRLGIGMHSYGAQWAQARQHPNGPFHDAFTFLDYAGSLGAGGVQVDLGVQTPAESRRIRRLADTRSLYLEAQGPLPRDPAGRDRFAAALATARACGARVYRTALLDGRRYEAFDSLDAFRHAAAAARESLRLAEPLLRRHRIQLAIENHKDWRIEELLALVEHASSEWIGILIDTGNSVALCEDPMAVIEAFAPWAVSTHLKDMAVARDADGFLLSEVVFGAGFLDLRAVVSRVERSNPRIRWNLEMITRDPLRVPCLESRYWASFDPGPARDLARALALVASRASPRPLPRTAGLSTMERVRLEDANVRACLAYAQAQLGFA